MAMPKSTPRRSGKPGQNRDSRDGVFGHLESQVGPLPRVGLYARVSTPHQHTIGMQLRQLREFLERRRWQEVLVVEEVVSESRRRPERDRLLDAARRREIDIIAVWRLDRWGRSLSDLMLTLRELQELEPDHSPWPRQYRYGARNAWAHRRAGSRKNYCVFAFPFW